MKQKKYTYYRIIQTNSGYGWDDDDFHEADSRGFPLDYKAFKENWLAYKENFRGGLRYITRKELND